MVTPQNTVSVGAQQALQDMIELQMYLVVQSRQTPWPMLPRRTKKPHGGERHEAKEPYSNTVEFEVAKELAGWGFIEASSSRTFVVSKSGYQFYTREMKSGPISSLNIRTTS